MVDLRELRAEVLDAQSDSTTRSDFGAFSSAGLASLFNKLVHEDLRIPTWAPASLTVRRTDGPIDGRMMTSLVDHFTRAVAAIGKEISAGGDGVLTPADYARAPVFPAMPAGGTLVLQAAPGPEVAGQVVDTTTERALVRLANMMPSGPDDATLGERITSARAMTMRAMSEVAEAARRVGGIEVSLDGTTEDVRGSLDKDQAKNIVDLAGDVTTSVRSVHVTGILDGMRVKRREYYLLDERDREYHGAVDEDIIMKMRELLDRPVVATLEEVTRRTRAGKVGRRAYRLVGITAAQ